MSDVKRSQGLSASPLALQSNDSLSECQERMRQLVIVFIEMFIASSSSEPGMPALSSEAA